MVKLVDETQLGLVHAIHIKTHLLERFLVNPISRRYSPKQPEKENLTPIRGLNTYGPYDVNTSDALIKRKFKGLEFTVFYPKGENAVKTSLKTLLRYLKEGYFERRGKPWEDPDFQGLVEQFRLAPLDLPKVGDFVAYSPGTLNKMIDSTDFDGNQARKRKNIPVALIGGTSHRSTKVRREQYIEAKQEFMKRDVPSQYASYFEGEGGGRGLLHKIRSRARVGYAVWDFTLGIYGKAGGTAWIVPQSSMDKSGCIPDLTIGLRFARSFDKKTRFYVGHAMVLDRFGCVVGIATSDRFSGKSVQRSSVPGMVVPADIMEEIVSDAIETASADSRVRPIFRQKEEINIAIHRPAMFHPNEEIPGIEVALKKTMATKDVKFGLVPIIEAQSVMMFGPETQNRRVNRRTSVTLNESTAILYTKDSGRLVSHPITVCLQNLGNEACLFNSIHACCNHVYNMCGPHW